MGIHGAARDFQFYGVSAVAKLLDHHQLVIRRHGHYVDPIHAIEDEEIVRLPGARRNLLVRANGEDSEIGERLGVEFGPGFDHGVME